MCESPAEIRGLSFTLSMQLLNGRVWMSAAAVLAVFFPLLAVSSPASATYEPGEPQVAWGRQVATDAEEVYGDVQVAGDDVWVTGFENTTGELHPVLARYDREGRLKDQWVSETGGAFNTSGIAMSAGSWGAVTATTVDSDTVLTRYESDGEQVWSVPLSTTQRNVSAIAVVDDKIVIAGTTGGQFGSWLVESFDYANGDPELSRTIPGYGSVGAVTSLDGQIVVGGLTMGEMVPDEQVGGDYDAVLISLDPADLGTTWQHQFGTLGNDWISAMAVRDDTLYWGGTIGNSDDNPYSAMVGGLGAWNPDGSQQWRTRLEGSAPVRDLIATSEGLVIGGEVLPGQLGQEIAGYGQQDAYLQGRSFTGQTLWTEVYGTNDWDSFTGLATQGDDRMYAVGYTGGRMFGDTKGKPWDAVLTALDVPHLQRPDLSVRVNERGFQGDNRYGATRNPIRVNVSRGSTRDLVIKLEDDGFLGDRQLLRSCAGRRGGPKLTLRNGHHDISHSTRNGTFRTRKLRPGSSQHLALQVHATQARAGSYICSLTTRSDSRRFETDTIKLKIVVTRRN